MSRPPPLTARPFTYKPHFLIVPLLIRKTYEGADQGSNHTEVVDAEFNCYVISRADGMAGTLACAQAWDMRDAQYHKRLLQMCSSLKTCIQRVPGLFVILALVFNVCIAFQECVHQCSRFEHIQLLGVVMCEHRQFTSGPWTDCVEICEAPRDHPGA